MYKTTCRDTGRRRCNINHFVIGSNSVVFKSLDIKSAVGKVSGRRKIIVSLFIEIRKKMPSAGTIDLIVKSIAGTVSYKGSSMDLFQILGQVIKNNGFRFF